MTKRKRRPKRKRIESARRRRQARVQERKKIDSALQRAERLIDQGRAQQAIALLRPLLKAHPRVPELHHAMGAALANAGDVWAALTAYEQAQQLSREDALWYPIATLALQLGLHYHALHAFRLLLNVEEGQSMAGEIREMIAGLEQELAQAAHQLDLPMGRVERGIELLEQGQRALHRGDFQAAADVNRRAIKQLGDWPPPHNNLAMALFFNGQFEEAMAQVRHVLSLDPQNVQALSNGVRHLAWHGQEGEARELWARLEQVAPRSAEEQLKIAEASASLEEDEAVYRTLEPLGTSSAAETLPPGLAPRALFFLAVAEANTGRRKEARRRFKGLATFDPRAEVFLVALEEGRPGPGWTHRFPYFYIEELVPGREIEALIDLAQRQEQSPSQSFRRQVERFVTRFPQIVRVAERVIWEEQNPEAGIELLALLDTPAAYQVLRRFGLSQVGEDQERMQALGALARAGQIPREETLRVWLDGEWQETQIRGYEISDEGFAYRQEVANLLDDGLAALKAEDAEQAEMLFQRALALEPRAKEAYNNLGTIYHRRQEHERAREMFRKAVEIDPLYAIPRCNLATYLLREDDIEGAKAMLEPLTEATHFHPQEMAFYSYTQAQIMVEEEEYEGARRSLEAALEVYPGYEPAQNMLDWLDEVSPLLQGLARMRARYREREQAKRARQQAKLTTPDPTLAQALPVYTKDMLTGMARQVIPWGGWSSLRKAELVEEIIRVLIDPDWLESIISDLDTEAREALQQVLDQGGGMSWREFDARYGNDLDESLYWNREIPETTMGQLRVRGVLVEATVDDELYVAIPTDLRPILPELLTG